MTVILEESCRGMHEGATRDKPAGGMVAIPVACFAVFVVAKDKAAAGRMWTVAAGDKTKRLHHVVPP